jgi:acetylornithine deacetylase/succinyl-diaminopimelate desuccinylase-like protein
VQEARAAAAVLGDEVAGKLPFADGVRPLSDDPTELLINSTWKPTLTITGAEGLPPIGNAGNVLLPRVAMKLSLRLPPTLDAAFAATEVQRVLEADPPYGARVQFDVQLVPGRMARAHAGTLARHRIGGAFQRHFGKPCLAMGTGGSIPFIGMLADRYPKTQFLVTGVFGT